MRMTLLTLANTMLTAIIASTPQTMKAAAPARAAGDSTVQKVAGDFNGDGVREEMWLEPPAGLDVDAGGCADPDCISHIRFSDPKLPAIPVKNCIGGLPANLGDLNGDGSDEIGLSPEWFSSCWAAYYVWRIKGNGWIYAVKPFSTHCIQFEDYTGPAVEKDPAHPGHAIIRYSESGEADILIKTKSVRLQ